MSLDYSIGKKIVDFLEKVPFSQGSVAKNLSTLQRRNSVSINPSSHICFTKIMNLLYNSFEVVELMSQKLRYSTLLVDLHSSYSV